MNRLFAPWDETIIDPPMKDVPTAKTDATSDQFAATLGTNDDTWKFCVENNGCPLIRISYADPDKVTAFKFNV